MSPFQSRAHSSMRIVAYAYLLSCARSSMRICAPLNMCLSSIYTHTHRYTFHQTWKCLSHYEWNLSRLYASNYYVSNCVCVYALSRIFHRSCDVRMYTHMRTHVVRVCACSYATHSIVRIPSTHTCASSIVRMCA